MISDGKRRMFRRHKLFAKGTNGQPMIHSRLINPELKQIDKDLKDYYENGVNRRIK